MFDRSMERSFNCLPRAKRMKVIAQLGRELQLIKNENKSLTIVFACAPPERYHKLHSPGTTGFCGTTDYAFDMAAINSQETEIAETSCDSSTPEQDIRPCLWAKILSTQIDFEYSNGVCKCVPANLPKHFAYLAREIFAYPI